MDPVRLRQELKFKLQHRLNLASRDSFSAYRANMHPRFKSGWWQKEIEKSLEQFHVAFKAGLRPILIIEAPPQHGKSDMVTDYVGWGAGKDPNIKFIYASRSERLGIRANLKLQRQMTSRRYSEMFPDTRLNSSNVVTQSGQFLRNREMLEFVEKEGSFRNVTVQGSVNGEGMHIGIIDDPVKDREEANSKTMRAKTWDWFTDVFGPRMDELGGLIFIMTRWNLDDLVGRVRSAYGGRCHVVSYPAIAEEDEKYRKKGEALFPEHKSIEFIKERKQAMSVAGFQSLYQQRPIIQGGNVFKKNWWSYWTQLPQLHYRVIFIDTAQKVKEENDYTVFQDWGFVVVPGGANQAYLLAQKREKFTAPELRRQAVNFWNARRADPLMEGQGILRELRIEDKSSGIGLIQELKELRIPVRAIPRTTDKVMRANNISPEVEAGNVWLPAGAPFLDEYEEEFATFPNGPHDDQVDATMDAVEELINPLTSGGSLVVKTKMVSQ